MSHKPAPTIEPGWSKDREYGEVRLDVLLNGKCVMTRRYSPGMVETMHRATVKKDDGPARSPTPSEVSRKMLNAVKGDLEEYRVPRQIQHVMAPRRREDE